jgi:uncharacterized membrane protein YfcA
VKSLALILVALIALVALRMALRWKAQQTALELQAQMHMSDEQTKAAVQAAKYQMGGGIAGGLGTALGGFARLFR